MGKLKGIRGGGKPQQKKIAKTGVGGKQEKIHGDV